MTISRGALLHVLCGTLSLVCLSGHLLHHWMALLSRGWKTFPDGGAGAVLIVLVPGDWRLLVLALLLRDIITDLNLGSNITTNRSGGWFTSRLTCDGTFLHGYFLGSDARDQDTTSSWLLPAVFDGNWRTMLSFGVVAFNLGNLVTIDVGNIEAVLLGDWTTLSLVFLLAVGSWDISALLLLDSVTNLLGDITTVLFGNLATFLLRNLAAFLLWNIVALLFVSNLLANLLVDSVALLTISCVTFFLVGSFTLAMVLSPAFLLWNSVTLPVIDNFTVLLRNIFTNLIMDVLTFLLVGDLAVSNEVGDALPLHHRLTLVLEPDAALSVVLGGTLFIVDGFFLVLRKIDTLELGSTVAFLVLDLGTLLVDVIGSITLLPVPDGTNLLVGVLLDRSLSDGTGSFLS